MTELFNQALQAQLANKLTLALTLYKQLLATQPTHKDSLFNAGLICAQIQDFNQAIYYLSQAASIQKNAAICSLLGLSYMNTQQSKKAIAYYQEAIIFDDQEYMAHNHLGILYCQNHEYKKGIQYLKKAIQINPHEYAALSDLGMALMQQGEYQQAALYFKKAIIASNNQSTVAYQNLLLCLCFDESAFPKHYLEEAKKLDHLLQSHAVPFKNWPQTNKQQHEPLNVGLICGDINNHPVGYFLESFISHVNPKTLNFFVYNTSRYEDDLTLRVKPFIKKWTNIQQHSDQQSAQIIYRDGVHILIDLAGHTAYNKLALFAFKPAPIQISFLGYFASTGMSFIDYFLTDIISVPPQYQYYFSEKIAYINQTRLCFSPPASRFNHPINPLPATIKGFITFGCFQNLSKINIKTLKLWKEILANNSKNILILLNQQFHDEIIKQEFIKKIIDIGIDPKQLVLKSGSSRSDYFKAYHDIDFMLDTFPYPGGTTTCEALWMGVPTLTLSGKTLLERQGHTIMCNAGLDDWVCFSENEYINKAITFSENLTKLSSIRSHLRSTLLEMPIMNAKKFANEFEQTLVKIWQNHKK